MGKTYGAFPLTDDGLDSSHNVFIREWCLCCTFPEFAKDSVAATFTCIENGIYPQSCAHMYHFSSQSTNSMDASQSPNEFRLTFSKIFYSFYMTPFYSILINGVLLFPNVVVTTVSSNKQQIAPGVSRSSFVVVLQSWHQRYSDHCIWLW